MRGTAGVFASWLQWAAARLCAGHHAWVRALAIAAAVLVTLNVLVQLFAFASGHDHVRGLVPLLDLDQEANLPSSFGAGLLLFAALLAALVAVGSGRRGGTGAASWAGLAVLLLWMTIDEVVGLHERLTDPMRDLLGRESPRALHFAWVLPGAAVAALVSALFVRFVQRLATPVRRRVLLAGLLYLGGALGMEMVGGYHAALHSTRTLTYRALLVSIEEGLEMAGMIVLVDASLIQLSAEQRLLPRRSGDARSGLPDRRRAPRVGRSSQASGRRVAAGIGMRGR